MSTTTFIWNEAERIGKAEFSIEHVGRLKFEVDSNLPGGGSRQTAEERKLLALRHAKLLVRNLARELERQ